MWWRERPPSFHLRRACKRRVWARKRRRGGGGVGEGGVRAWRLRGKACGEAWKDCSQASEEEEEGEGGARRVVRCVWRRARVEEGSIFGGWVGGWGVALGWGGSSGEVNTSLRHRVALAFGLSFWRVGLPCMVWCRSCVSVMGSGGGWMRCAFAGERSSGETMREGDSPRRRRIVPSGACGCQGKAHVHAHIGTTTTTRRRRRRRPWQWRWKTHKRCPFLFPTLPIVMQQRTER